jgi:hypothetical protein
MSGLDSGEYVLKVISGNCNVLMTDFDPEVTTPVGDFAEPADNVPGTVEDTISFYWDSGAVEEFDWGDADDPTYPTLAASLGANHVIVPGFTLGLLIDAEPDGQPLPVASSTGDDIANLADEDGVAIPALAEGVGTNIVVTLNPGYVGPAFLDAWADWNGNGSWADAGDQIAASLALVPGPNNVPVTPPAGSAGVAPVCRFRLSTVGALSYTGVAFDGEVEDHIGPEILPGGCTVAPLVERAESFK